MIHASRLRFGKERATAARNTPRHFSSPTNTPRHSSLTVCIEELVLIRLRGLQQEICFHYRRPFSMIIVIVEFALKMGNAERVVVDARLLGVIIAPRHGVVGKTSKTGHHRHPDAQNIRDLPKNPGNESKMANPNPATCQRGPNIQRRIASWKTRTPPAIFLRGMKNVHYFLRGPLRAARGC